jgi:hypothetical protein
MPRPHGQDISCVCSLPEREDRAFAEASGRPFPLACDSNALVTVRRLHPRRIGRLCAERRTGTARVDGPCRLWDRQIAGKVISHTEALDTLGNPGLQLAGAPARIVCAALTILGRLGIGCLGALPVLGSSRGGGGLFLENSPITCRWAYFERRLSAHFLPPD